MLVCRAHDESATDAAGRCCRFAPFHAAKPRRDRWYPTDTTDAQWAVVEPLLPATEFFQGRGARPKAHCRRAIIETIFYVVEIGIKGWALLADFPPHSTVFKYFTRWERARACGRILDAFQDKVPLADDRTAETTAAIMEFASLRGSKTVGAATGGYDAGR